MLQHQLQRQVLQKQALGSFNQCGNTLAFFFRHITAARIAGRVWLRHNKRYAAHGALIRKMPDKTFTSVTLHGFPVRIELQWPFHRSEGGSDWYVVHGRLWLNDASGLHADIALNLAQTIKDVLPSLDSDLAFWVAVNTARKALDEKQLELLKSGKRQPVPVSSRCYSIRHQQFTFANATPEQVAEFVARKVFWGSGDAREPVVISDPCDAQYLGAGDSNTVDRLVVAARDLAARGMIELAGDHARATDGLLAQRDAFIAAKDHALEELHAKHAFERG